MGNKFSVYTNAYAAQREAATLQTRSQYSGALAADSDCHLRCTRTIQRPLVCFFHVLVAHMSRCRL